MPKETSSLVWLLQPQPVAMSTGTNPARCLSVCLASIGCLAAPSGGMGTAPALPTSPVCSQSGPVATGLSVEGTLCHPDGSSPMTDGTGGTRRGEEVFLERARGLGHATPRCSRALCWILCLLLLGSPRLHPPRVQKAPTTREKEQEPPQLPIVWGQRRVHKARRFPFFISRSGKDRRDSGITSTLPVLYHYLGFMPLVSSSQEARNICWGDWAIQIPHLTRK